MKFLVVALVLCIMLAAGSHSATVSDIVQPINIPKGMIKCSQPLVSTQFSGSSPLIEVPYTPSSECKGWSKLVLELSGSCKAAGVSKEQKVGGVWLGGAQILHVTTPLPTPQGTNWTVQSDMSIYEYLFQSTSNLSVIFLDMTSEDSSQETVASYSITISASFYKSGKDDQENNNVINYVLSPLSQKTILEVDQDGLFPPPVIVPIHPPPSNTTGLWFAFEDDQTHSVMITAPTTVIDARLLVFVSPHAEDEFWYKTGMREVVITFDDTVVDAIWPRPLIYSSGTNSSYWQSVGAIGALNVPSYDIILDAFADVLADGKPHKIGFRVTGAKKVWFLGASMYAFTSVTSQVGKNAGLIRSNASDTTISHPGAGITEAFRNFSSQGVHAVRNVNITTSIERQLHFRSWQSDNGTLEQLTSLKTIYSSQAADDSVNLHWVDEESMLSTFTVKVEQSLTHKFDSALRFGSNNGTVQGGNFTSIFKNHQVAGPDGTSQDVSFLDTHLNCYSRNLLVANFVYTYDNVSTTCP